MIARSPERFSLANTLVEVIATSILQGQRLPGEMLPTEFQLSKQFGVSRTVVREAVARLQYSGLVHVRQGTGTIVLDRDQWRDLDPELLRVRASAGLIGDLAPDLLAVRRTIEIEVAGMAAMTRTEDQLDLIAHLLDKMRGAGNSPGLQTDLDIQFHEALILATGNRLMLQMMQPINKLRRIGSIITTSKDSKIIASSVAGHMAIFVEIVDGNVNGARSAMAAHLERFEQELSSSMAVAPSSQHNIPGASD